MSIAAFELRTPAAMLDSQPTTSYPPHGAEAVVDYGFLPRCWAPGMLFKAEVSLSPMPV